MRIQLFAASAAIALLPVPAFAQRAAPVPGPVAVAVDPAVAAARDAALTDDVAWDVVEGLTTEIGQRLAATEAEARARAWAVRKLTALGFANVHVETFRMPLWQRGVETAEVVGPFAQKLTLAALGNSGATPAGGLTAEVVYFPSFNDLLAAPDGSLKGRIAFIGNSMTPTQDGSSYGPGGQPRRLGPSVAARKGAVATIIRSAGTDYHRNPHTGGTNWDKGQAPTAAAALSLPDAEQLVRLLKRGPVTLHLTVTSKLAGEADSGNVVADIPGSDPAAGAILIGGHLDSWDLGTGAIDDGAGVAITTAAALRVKAMGQPRRTIRVVWFGAEEPGGFGGEAYAKAHATENHVAAGESDFGADRVWRFQTTLADKALTDRIAATLAPLGIGYATGGGDGGTDGGPTIRQGAATIALGQSGTRYFDYHHTPDDTLDKIDPAQLRQNVAAWTAALAILANAPEMLSKGPVR